MDGRQFDGLTKQLAGGAGARRDVVKGLAGGLLAGALGLVGSRAARANHKSSHCAHEGEKVETGNSGKECCEGLIEGADGRCEPEPCVGSCAGKCGGADNGCGISCTGTCPECQTCSAGSCVLDPAQICAACGPINPENQMRCRNGVCGAPGGC